MSIALLIGLAVICVAGVVLAALQLPGTWLILAAALAYDWYGGWTEIGWKWLVGLAVVAVIAEVADSASAVLLARRAGASRRASIGALVGGFAGMFVLSVPLPLVGTIVGGLVGCFVGAWRQLVVSPMNRLPSLATITTARDASTAIFKTVETELMLTFHVKHMQTA